MRLRRQRVVALAGVAGLALTACTSGMARDVAAGYRSTPEYPEYVDARDGRNDALECGATLAGMLAAQWIASDFESKTGYDADSGNPTTWDWIGGLFMSMMFAFAEERPYSVSDACAAAAVADASNQRLRD